MSEPFVYDPLTGVVSPTETVPSNGKSCGTCKYFQPKSELRQLTNGGYPEVVMGYSGQCRYDPPVMSSAVAWPQTTSVEWCGRHAAGAE